MIDFPMEMCDRSVVIDGIPLSNNQGYVYGGYSPLSSLRGDVGVYDSNAFLNSSRDSQIGIPHLVENIEFREELIGEAPILSHNTVGTLSDETSDAQENLQNLAVSPPMIYPFKAFRARASNDLSSGLHSLMEISENCGYNNEVVVNMNDNWGLENSIKVHGYHHQHQRTNFPTTPSLLGDIHQSAWISSPNDPNVGMDYTYKLSNCSNELSLSLAATQPTVVSCRNNSDQYSEQSSCNSKEEYICFGPDGPTPFSQIICGSRYLNAVQEILARIANFSLGSFGQTKYANCGDVGEVNIPFLNGMKQGDSCEFRCFEDGFEAQTEPATSERAVEAKKDQLLTLLQVVDERYNQCLDEIHTVVSTFHTATELDPRVHTGFALQTVSFLYKNLRERISNLILATGSLFDDTRGKDKSFENSFIQEQWALQQLKRKNYQLWRPQRGLPERSVSVLRAWMFQNFLHPYPKDAEKHLLAVKSGLTRSQVSNWFINARVRLWKPMIEQMYSEMNRRKARRSGEKEHQMVNASPNKYLI